MSKQYFLYGAGELGKRTLEHFHKNDLAVEAFIDKKAIGVINGVPIICLADLERSEIEKKDSFVIICLNSGMQHREVADNLYELGFTKIIFLPMEYAIEYKEKVRMTAIYNEALLGVDVSNKVKNYQEYITMAWKESIIHEGYNEIIAWVGQEIFFSERIDTWKGDKSKIHTVNDGIDVNLNVYCWMYNLFDYLEGKTSDCTQYLSVYDIDFQTEVARELISDRARLVADLQNKLSYGIDFFIEAAPNVVWNNKGYFNIVGGNHRTIFLQYHGHIFYPARIEAEDYKMWKNEQCLQEVITYIEENEIQSTYVPVPHPSFINFPYLREGWGKTILGDVLRYLGPLRLEGKTVVDASQYEGYFARVVKRMCAQNVLFYNHTKKIICFADRLFKLLHLEGIEVADSEETLSSSCDDADIIFGMLNTEELVKKNYLRNFSGKLFVEYCIENDGFIEMVLENTEMNHYKMLHREVFRGEMLEVGVFEA